MSVLRVAFHSWLSSVGAQARTTRAGHGHRCRMLEGMARLAGGSPDPRVAGRGGYNLFPGLPNRKESRVKITRVDVSFDTDEGVYGIGEASLSGRTRALDAAFDDLTPLLICQDATRTGPLAGASRVAHRGRCRRTPRARTVLRDGSATGLPGTMRSPAVHPTTAC